MEGWKEGYQWNVGWVIVFVLALSLSHLPWAKLLPDWLKNFYVLCQIWLKQFAVVIHTPSCKRHSLAKKIHIWLRSFQNHLAKFVSNSQTLALTQSVAGMACVCEVCMRISF
jgi:hypothetical protein